MTIRQLGVVPVLQIENITSYGIYQFDMKLMNKYFKISFTQVYKWWDEWGGLAIAHKNTEMGECKYENFFNDSTYKEGFKVFDFKGPNGEMYSLCPVKESLDYNIKIR